MNRRTGLCVLPGVVALGCAPSLALAIDPTYGQPISSGDVLIPAARRGPNIEGGLGIPGGDHFDNYSGYQLTNLTNPPSSLIPLGGQLNPAGVEWSSAPFFGVANASTLAAIGAPAPMGAPPHGLLTTRYALSARGAIETPYNPKLGILANNRHNVFFPDSTQPVVITQDMYLESPDDQPRTTVWWSPVSFTSFSIYDRVFFGGTNLQGQLGGFANGEGVTDRFLHLGRIPGGVGEAFFASAETTVFDFPVNQWFTIMVHVSAPQPNVSGYSFWIKTPGTVAANPPYIDPRMASGDIPAPDGEPIGWVNTYPGRGDNFATPQVREGIGLARTSTGVAASQLGHLAQAPVFDLIAFDGVQYGWGFDDPLNANFEPDNYYFANYSVRGDFTQLTCPPDFSQNGVVGGEDLAILLTNWGPDGGFGPMDLNTDGQINGGDLAVMLTSWGPCFDTIAAP